MIKPSTQRVSSPDGSSVRVRFTPDGVDDQGQHRIEMAIKNASAGARRYFIQVEPTHADPGNTGDAFNDYTELVGAGKTYTMSLLADGPVSLTSVHMCQPAPKTLVSRVGWDRSWSKQHHTEDSLYNWSVTGRLTSTAPTVIIEATTRGKDGTQVDSWGWSIPGLPEIGVTWGPEVPLGSKVQLTSVATCSSWSIWDEK